MYQASMQGPGVMRIQFSGSCRLKRTSFDRPPGLPKSSPVAYADVMAGVGISGIQVGMASPVSMSSDSESFSLSSSDNCSPAAPADGAPSPDRMLSIKFW